MQLYVKPKCSVAARYGLVETTLKEITEDDAGRYWLTPRSTDPSFAPIPMDLRDADNDDGVTIIGVVIASQRPRRKGDGPLIR